MAVVCPIYTCKCFLNSDFREVGSDVLTQIFTDICLLENLHYSRSVSTYMLVSWRHGPGQTIVLFNFTAKKHRKQLASIAQHMLFCCSSLSKWLFWITCLYKTNMFSS